MVIGEAVTKKIRSFRRSPLEASYNLAQRFLSFCEPLVDHRAKQKLGPHCQLFSARPPEAIVPHYRDLWYLYRQVLQRKPRVIIELGSGCSTIILAQALKENQAGFLYSLDASEHWLEVTRASLPRELLPYCELRYAPVEKIDYKGVPAFRHRNLPAVQADFIYLDSPPLTEARAVAVDPLDLEDTSSARLFVVVDGRIRNALFLKEHLHYRYRVRFNPFLHHTTFERIG